jgi:hypothetical protein
MTQKPFSYVTVSWYMKSLLNHSAEFYKHKFAYIQHLKSFLFLLINLISLESRSC